jgi:transposase
MGGRVAEAYPVAFRRRVLADCDAGLGTTETAGKFGVSRAWVRRLKQHRRERDGDIAPRSGGGSRGRKIDRAKLAELVEQRPDATLLELADLLGVTCVKSAVWKALRQLKLSYKKSRSAPPSRTGRTWRNAGPRGA